MLRGAVGRKMTAEHLGGSRVRFTCTRCGHTLTRTQMMGPRGMRRAMSEAILKDCVRRWNASGGATKKCGHCAYPGRVLTPKE